MSVFSYIKGKFENLKYAITFNGSTAVFSQFGEDIYASDIVQSIIDCMVSEMCKLNPLHILNKDNDRIPVNDSIQKILKNPNELMTTYDFMSKVMWNLFLNYNSIIYPVYKIVKDKKGKVTKKYTAFYPLQPQIVDMLEDNSGKLFIRMHFRNSMEFTLPYEDVIHIRYKFSFNDFLGGNRNGQPDNQALLKLLQMNDNMIEGFVMAMKTSFNTTGIIKSGTMMDQEKVKTMVKEFNEQLESGGQGILGIEAKADYIPITKKIQVIDPEVVKFIDTRILRNWGVALPILTGEFTKAQYEAFYQKKLEPLIICIAQSFTKTLFTERELAFGHEIVWLPKALIFMDTSQTLEAIRIMGDAGDLYENEKRMAIGLMPLEELVGVRMQSLNYVNVDYAKEYQLKESQRKDIQK